MLQATSLYLNEGLEVIGDRALQHADKLEIVSFPSTLKEIGPLACEQWESIGDIYCSATIPPVCHDDTFGQVDMEKVTLWVPEGCAEEYRQAVGWTNFINIIETSQFPTAGIQFTVIDDNSNNGDLYDLMGRKVSNPQPGTIYFRDGNKFIYH